MAAKTLLDSIRGDDKIRGDIASNQRNDGERASEIAKQLKVDILTDMAATSGGERQHKVRAVMDNVRREAETLHNHTVHALAESEEQSAASLRSAMLKSQHSIAGTLVENPEQILADLRSQADLLKLTLDRQQRTNVALEREVLRLRAQSDRQEADRDFLVARLVEARAAADNDFACATDSRNSLLALQSELADIQRAAEDKAERSLTERAVAMHGPVPSGASLTDEAALVLAEHVSDGLSITGVPGLGRTALSGLSLPDEAILYGVIRKLKSMLDAESRTVRTLRETLRKDKESRAGAEILLRQAVDDAEIALAARRKALGAQAPGRRSADAAGGKTRIGPSVPTAIPEEERQSLLAAVLAQEHVLSAIQAAVFPRGPDGSPVTKGHVASAKDALARAATMLK